jgi:hypothetical protein
VAVPKEIVEHNKIVTVAADVFFVDRGAFPLTVPRQIKFITVELKRVPLSIATWRY